MPDNDKGATLNDRVLSYGDVAVEQGKVATQSSVVPPAKAAPATVEVINVILIDRRRLVSDGARTTIKTRLTRDLNALGVVNKEPDVLKAKGLRFEVRWESKMPSAAQQEAYDKWDFPLYFEKAHTSDNLPSSEVTKRMQAHGIRNAGKAAQQFKAADEGWASKAVEGLGIQPLSGYRKLGFIKVDEISSRATDIETAYINVVKHEFGHMCNITQHASAGLMLASVPMSDPRITFAESNQRAVLRELQRLQALTEEQMQRLYERQTT